MTYQAETVLTNARLVLSDHVVLGTLVLRGGLIADIAEGASSLPGALDFGGDILMPGIIDLHTDNLERQVEPRAGARWPSRSAFLAHDGQCAAAGVTTVFDALCLGNLGIDKDDRARTFREGVSDLTALSGSGLFKSDHVLHLRCELPAADMLDSLHTVAEHPLVRMVSLMDHTPGVGQYADLERFRARKRREGMAPSDIEVLIEHLMSQRAKLREPNRRALLDLVRTLPVVLASHDDETVEEIADNHADGITISEFPVRLAAARAAKSHGMDVIAGAPNIVRGGSHSGNVSAAEMLAAGAVDALASDYVPPALVEACFVAADAGLPLAAAVALITSGPARLAGLKDRGRLMPGLRADLVRVRRYEGLAAPMAVWRQGERVA
ncbi:alpha-D-ribose 1-methylphosphonate 5-triphosphate diphosphatase [Acidisoma cladoniae]|uniref:alpha-D-ribose 1-methylphosphonate 5-triphosphate diphosphatase n=1 Tax=Acidisoma cladoniae TaxID=3040935 RepID=UPI00254EBAA7|nr:alpha-D-ribose 1-methylphosphonate 5-triphosphate diphosphatase [Acidisoma sp. PAMC 29798]